MTHTQMAYNYQLLLKHLLHQGLTWAPDQQIIYRDHVRFTYCSFYQRVLQLGGALESLGCGLGAKIGVIDWDSHRYLEMYFGIPGIGAILHTINPGIAPKDLLYTLVHAEDEILIFHEDFIPLVESLIPFLPTVHKYILIRDNPVAQTLGWVNLEYEELLANAIPLKELPDLDENTIATISYTSGTTGKPKGVFFTQRQLTLQTLSDAVALSALGNYGGVSKHDVYMPLTPMYHGHAWGMPYVATMLGLKQVYPGKYEIPRIIQLIIDEKVTFSHCVPTILQKIVGTPLVRDLDLSQWKVIVGGSALSKSLAIEASRLGIKVYGGYGLSETCPVLTISNLKPGMEAWNDEKKLDWMIKPGFTIPLVYLKVIDSNGKEVAKNGRDAGEILVRSPWCTQAYFKDVDLSEKLWDGDWLHTGDIGTIDEYGYIQIVDRFKDIIKTGGEWIVSLELEKMLSSFTGILDVAVIGIPDQKWGERPLVLMESRSGCMDDLTAENLKTHLQKYVLDGKLAAWAVPDFYACINEIPKTNVGKHDKKALRTLINQDGWLSEHIKLTN
ncbi:MAG: long-chain-fatty-acid--CoA ligase [Chloroflexi bacterium]|nr:long-chain-fatty-acid--CoA ligase [Chloroflexota bacterium]